jgi:hypothetical protein
MSECSSKNESAKETQHGVPSWTKQAGPSHQLCNNSSAVLNADLYEKELTKIMFLNRRRLMFPSQAQKSKLSKLHVLSFLF